MKNLLFGILVVLLTPIYVAIVLGKYFVKVSRAFLDPVAEAMQILFENMQDFWKRKLRRTNKKEQGTQQINNKINETVENLMVHKTIPNQAREKIRIKENGVNYNENV